MDTSVDSLSSVDTSFPDLSSVRQEDIQNVTSTIQNLLSSLRQINADIAASREEIPDHPFERLKYEYSHPEAEPISYESIKVPDNFCPIQATQKLNEISDKNSNRFDEHINALSGTDINDYPYFGNAFASHVDGQFILDKKTAATHLQFVDMIRQIPVEYIKANPEEFARKIISKYIEVYQ